ncbi:RING-H2 finger protein ATL46 isoform X4 [Ziziphus jujuba]|uniref:RING-type E3 ubiquitin transferase n=1 Tax=Ziziphus jujuba TaxID=326968 RepID=A0A6P6FVR4_ZIZJJ|nr:RING-H2 finger protein ATL46 isoform X4 [Ziziphus jujuba]
MSRIPYKLKQNDANLVYPSTLPPLYAVSIPSESANNGQESTPSSSSHIRISPVLLLFIIILAVIVFISGLVHLLLKFLIKRSPSSPIYQSNRFPETSGSHALQRQLQQLFRLHDSGLDQALIDALPVFYYADIVGLKEPFDCAVCLCEFSNQDQLRSTLLNCGFFMENPMFNINSQDSREIPSWFPSDADNRHSSNQKSLVTEEAVGEKRVFSVRLGKFRSLNDGVESGGRVGETSSCSLDARRCYSMGTFQYVVGDSNLQVALHNDSGSINGGGASDVKLVKDEVHQGKFSVNGDLEGKRISHRPKGDSLSVSKIWLWSKKSRCPNSSNTDITVPQFLNVSYPTNGETQNYINGI